MDQEQKIERAETQQLGAEFVEESAAQGREESVVSGAEESVAQESTRARKGSFPTWIDMLAILGLFFIAQFITGLLAVAMGWQLSLPDDMTTLTAALQRASELEVGHSLFWWALISQVLMLMLVVAYRAIRGGGWGYVRCSVNGFNPSVLLLGVVLLFSLVIIMEPLLALLPDVAEPAGRGPYMILALLVVAPVCEELLCRGIVLSAMREKYNAWVGCLVAALVFAVMHVEPQAVVNAFVLGLLLGYVYLRTNSIFAPIILHAINNILAYMFLIFDVGHLSLMEVLGSGSLYTLIYCSAVGIMLLSMISISRRMRSIEQSDRERRMSSIK